VNATFYVKDEGNGVSLWVSAEMYNQVTNDLMAIIEYLMECQKKNPLSGA
jgi:hypothetical protein